MKNTSMREDLTVIAKSNKHNGYCVAAINKKGRIIRLVRDKEGHALFKESCGGFNKLDKITASIRPAPLKNQQENFIMEEVLGTAGTVKSSDFNGLLSNSAFIFGNAEPWLNKNEMKKQTPTFLLADVEDLQIYRNNEDKYKADFLYKNNEYKGFSITDPKFLHGTRRIEKARLLFSLPDAPYSRYGLELFYKFICAVYI